MPNDAVRILVALFAGLVIGISVGWDLGRTRPHTERENVVTQKDTASTGNIGRRDSMLDLLECHDKVVAHGAETLIFPKEVQSLFGASNVDHFISGFGSKAHQP